MKKTIWVECEKPDSNLKPIANVVSEQEEEDSFYYPQYQDINTNEFYRCYNNLWEKCVEVAPQLIECEPPQETLNFVCMSKIDNGWYGQHTNKYGEVYFRDNNKKWWKYE